MPNDAHWNSPLAAFQTPPEGHMPVEIGETDREGWFRLIVDGQRVPYIDMREVTDERKVAPPSEPSEWADEGHRLRRHAVERGERIFNLFLDDRFGTTATEGDLLHQGWFWANAMAVSAGYTSHGPNSRPLNRHGPSRK